MLPALVVSVPSPETLEAYRALVESADDVILIADWESARFVDANRVALERLGYPLVQLRTMTGGDLSQFPRETHRRLSEELVERGETHARDVPIRCRDGSMLRMDLWVKRFEADGGTFSANVLRDAHRTRQSDHPVSIARERLLESEALYRGVVTCTEDAVLVHDLETGAFIEANPAACGLFGYSSVQWADVSRSALLPESADALWQEVDAELREIGSSRRTEVELVRSDAERFWADTMQNVFEPAGRKLVVTIVRDVSERRRQREALERSRRLVALGEVAAAVAHEVNNPATFVRMNCEALLEELDRFEQDPSTVNVAAMRDALRDSLDGVERIHAVTRNLRQFARTDDALGKSVSPNAILRAAVRLVRNELRHRARVVLDLAEELPNIVVHRHRLEQVFTNLLLNAGQSITEGNADANEICVSSGVDGDDVWMAIEDTGCGMSDATMARAFEPFFTTKLGELGTGLGLAVCAEIVAKHGGTIGVTSALGEGSRFEVRLPRETGITPRAAPIPVTPQSSGAGKRILVIDDDPGMVRAYRRMLRHHHATVVSSGTEALAILADDDGFDVILCDLMMPVLDGPTFYTQLSERAPHLIERIVFCTGGIFTDRVRRFVASVENDVLDKPITRETMDRLLGD